MNIHIREEQPTDALSIHEVTVAAFMEAPHTNHTEQFIVNALRESGVLSLSLVAEVDGSVVGHVAVSPVTISDGTDSWYGLGPISVLPDFQGAGIGSKLMSEAMQALETLHAKGCVLLGDPSYYVRFGFRPEEGLTLQAVPPEYFQVRMFRGELPQGSVTYHEAFLAQH